MEEAAIRVGQLRVWAGDPKIIDYRNGRLFLVLARREVGTGLWSSDSAWTIELYLDSTSLIEWEWSSSMRDLSQVIAEAEGS